MAEVTRRRTGELLRKLFELLIASPDGMPAKEVLAALGSRVKMTEYEAGEYESGSRRFEKIVRFSTVDTVKAGWLLKEAGVWSVTQAGRKAYEKLLDPEAFYKEAVRLYHEWKKTRGEVPGGDDAPEIEGNDLSEKALQSALETATDEARRTIQAFLGKMNEYDFQDLVASLLEAMGYHVYWKAKGGPDGGIDILAFNDPLGTKPPRIKVQVKRVAKKIDVDGLRAFSGVLGEDDVGIFVNLGGFTGPAEEASRSKRITLVDGAKLVELWTEHFDKLDNEARRRMPVRPVFFLAPTD